MGHTCVEGKWRLIEHELAQVQIFVPLYKTCSCHRFRPRPSACWHSNPKLSVCFSESMELFSSQRRPAGLPWALPCVQPFCIEGQHLNSKLFIEWIEGSASGNPDQKTTLCLQSSPRQRCGVWHWDVLLDLGLSHSAVSKWAESWAKAVQWLNQWCLFASYPPFTQQNELPIELPSKETVQFCNYSLDKNIPFTARDKSKSCQCLEKADVF